MDRRQLLMLMGLAPVAASVAPVASYLNKQAHPRKIRTTTGFHGDYFPNVVLRTQDGKRVRLYDDLLKGKSVLINFFYADCRDGICPVTTENLMRLHALLGDRVGRDVFMYSFSLAPEQDTPERLKRYVKMHGVGPGWQFLTGSRDDMELCRVRLGFTDPDPEVDRKKGQHTAVVLMGNEPRQCWMASPAASRPGFLLEQLNRVAGVAS